MKPPFPDMPFPGISQLLVGDLRIDLRYRRVMRPDQDVELPQRMFDLLLVFLSEPGTLHTRGALFDRVWPGVIVEDANLSQSVWMLRKALGEQRKHWIRTVAKSGYVFEPPTPVEAFDGTPPPAATAEPATGIAAATEASAAATPAVDNTAPVQAPIPTARFFASRFLGARLLGSHRPAARILLAVLFAATLALPSSSVNLRLRHAVAEPPANVVTVLQAETAAGGDAPHWPVELLDEWLSWKLKLLPDAVPLSREHLAAEAPETRTRLVVLSVETVPGETGAIVLRARLSMTAALASGVQGADAGAESIAMRGSLDEVPAMVDALSQRVIARLLPDRADAAWPALTLDAAAAEHYAQASSAMHRRDWNAAVAAAEAVVRAAPDFGMAHLKLAEVNLRRGRFSESLEHMAKARRWMRPMPQDAERVFAAHEMSTDPRRQQQAIDTYASLVRDYPARRDFAFLHAELLMRASRPREAMAILSGPGWQWQQRPLGVRIRQHIALSRAELMLGFPAKARQNAQQALELVAQAGAGWELERGGARLLLAQIHHSEPGRLPSPQLFELAAQSFNAGNATLDALYARFLAERTLAPAAGGMSPRMRSLLTEARTHGFASLEIELLRGAAYGHHKAGQYAEYRDLLQQALQAANASGDPVLQDMLDFDLLNEDVVIGNFASAEARIARLQRNELPGEQALWVVELGSAINMQRGRYREALEQLRQGELAVTAGGRMPTPDRSAASLACRRIDILLTRGDVAAARALFDRCRRPEEPMMRLEAQLYEAAADMLDGDRARARVTLDEIERILSAMPDGSDRWFASISAAALFARLGEYDRAARLYAVALPMAESAGYGLLAAHIETGLAEVAAARRNWPLSRQLADRARRRVAPDIWLVVHRLDTLEIVDALTVGDRRTATAELLALRSQAQRLGDGVVMAELDSLYADRLLDTRETPAPPHFARKPLRGATLDWLTGPRLPANGIAQSPAAEGQNQFTQR